MSRKLGLAIMGAFGSATTFAAGSIVFDNTLPGQAHGTTTVVPLQSGHYTIDAAHTGYLTAKNLFESFATFSIAAGEEADFTNSTNLSISNVISRVTGIGSSNGLQPTTINGNLISSIAGANFWFVNPAGVMIGAGVTINVPAGLAIGKADFIQFSDNSRWYAIGSTAPTPSVLSTASPASFGFLSGSAPQVVDSGTQTLVAPSGQTSFVAGGAVTLQSVNIDTSSTGAAIAINGRSVELDQTLLATGGSDVTINGSTGNVVLRGSVVDAMGGSIAISGAGILVANQSLVTSVGTLTTITIQSTGTTVEANPQTILDHATSGVVRIVDSEIISPAYEVSGGVIILGEGEQSASGGTATNDVVIAGSIVASGGVGYDDMFIRATRGVWIESSELSSLTPYTDALQPSFEGHISIAAGDRGVTVAHSTISVDDSYSSIDYLVGGVASIQIAASGGPINLIDSMLSAQATGTRPGGSISLETSALPGNAPGSNATAAGISLTSTQLISSQTAQGSSILQYPSGDISISSAGNFVMGTGSSIVSNAGPNASSPGIVEITAGGALSIGNSVISAVNNVGSTGGEILLNSANSVSLDRTTIDASTTAGSSGSNIAIVAPLVAISGSTISSSAINAGNAGNITVSADGPDPQSGSALQIFGTQLSSTATASGCCAGDINITASQGSIALGRPSNGSLSTSIATFADASSGQAGKITISANRNLSVQDVSFDTSVATTAATGLIPGQISLSSSNGAIGLVGSTLQASTSGAVAAGDISVSAPTVSMNGGSITASTTGTANAGDIMLVASGTDPQGAAALKITGGAQILSATGVGASASANAGKVDLAANAGSVQIGLSSDAVPTAVSTSAGIGAGAAGAITITGLSIALGDANVSTTTAQGPASGVQPGSIVLMANGGGGPLSVTNSTLSASTSGVQSAGEVDLYGGPITIGNSSISSGTTAAGAAGNIIISGSNVSITGGATGHDISVSTSGSGAAGDITVTASGVDLLGAAALQITGFRVGSTAAGTPLGFAGNAGTVSISATNGSIELGSNAAGALPTQIQSSAGVFAGQAGTVKISAAQNLGLQDTSVDTSVATIVNNVAYTPGQIVLTAAGPISLVQSNLTASTSGAIAAGGITVTAPAVLMNGGSITASTTGTARAGDIAITASGADPQGGAALQLIGGASISSDASDGLSAAANAGKVTLSASNGSVQIGLPTDANPTAVSTSAGSAAGAPGAIAVNGTGIALGDATLTTTAAGAGAVAKPGTITLTANDGSGQLTVSNSTLSANTTGASQAGEIDLSGGSITVSDSSLSSATTAAGAAGAINILGSTINVMGSQVSVATAGTGNAGDIAITASGADQQAGAALQIAGTTVRSTAAGTAAGSLAGNAGAITLDATAGSIGLGSSAAGSAATQIQTSANAFAGQAGTIKMTAAHGLTLQDTTVDTSVATATTNTRFAPGEIVLTAPGAITMTGSTLQATTAGTVAAGDINVTAGGALQIASGSMPASAAVISSSTSTASSAGAAGKINLTGATIALDYANIAATIVGGSPITSPANIVLTAGRPIAVVDGSTINADTFGAAPGGSIQFLTPGTITLADVGTRISSNTSGDGVGGNIEFGRAAAPQHSVFAAPIAALSVLGGATVSVNARGADAAAGKGGTLSIYATGPVTLSGTDTALSSQSSTAALGGSVTVSAASLSMSDGAVITADTSSGPSNAAATTANRATAKAASATAAPTTGGSIAVTASGGISLAGLGTAISASASAAGSGGTVDLTADALTMSDGARIATQATGTGNSGAITINLKPALSPAGTLAPLPVLLSDSLITTTAVSSSGGNIQINADGSPLSLRGSAIETSAGAGGNGGNITISDAGGTILQASGILAEANAGNGGAITINLAPGALFVEDSQSLVSAQSAAGTNGTVLISTPPSDLNSALTVPDVYVARALELDSNLCKRNGGRSTFVREGRGGLALEPDAYLASVPADSSPALTESIPRTQEISAASLRIMSASGGCVGSSKVTD
jgi:filamentous hemagglutinin family protein